LTWENGALPTAKDSTVSKNCYPFFRHCGHKVEQQIRTFYCSSGMSLTDLSSPLQFIVPELQLRMQTPKQGSCRDFFCFEKRITDDFKVRKQ